MSVIGTVIRLKDADDITSDDVLYEIISEPYRRSPVPTGTECVDVKPLGKAPRDKPGFIWWPMNTASWEICTPGPPSDLEAHCP